MTTSKTILIAEDNEDLLLILAMQLRGAGHLVVEAQDGLEALIKLKEKRPDLLLLDLAMPRLNGFEVLEKLQEDVELQTIPVIILSGLEDFEVISRCIGLGVYDYVIKPYAPAELLKRISDALEDGRDIPSSPRLHSSHNS